MENKNGTEVTDAQRKAFCEVVDYKYNRLISKAKDNAELLVREITDQVRVKLGVGRLDSQIEALKKKMELISSKKSKLGFPQYEYLGLAPHSKAALLVQAGTRQNSEIIEGLETERLTQKANLWAAHSVQEIKLILKHLPEPKVLKQLKQPQAYAIVNRKRKPTPKQ